MQSGRPDPEVGPALPETNDANNPLSLCLNPRTISSKSTESFRVEAYWLKRQGTWNTVSYDAR